MQNDKGKYVETPVKELGLLRLSNGKIDICQLEGNPKNSIAGTFGVDVKPGKYMAYSGLHGERIISIMLVHESYKEEVLSTPEEIGGCYVGSTGIVGLFRNPKRIYTKDSLKQYLKDLKHFHEGATEYAELDTRKLAVAVDEFAGYKCKAYAHRDQDGNIDAVSLFVGTTQEVDA